jgi:hypothetical protein
MRDRTDLRWNGLALHLGDQTEPLLMIVPDDRWSGTYCIRLRDGCLSNMVNLTRAKDAAADLALAELNAPKGSSGPADQPPMRSARLATVRYRAGHFERASPAS